jgi:TetR/AcrR family transcriptional regulator, lmrAB and yxaGH operons repressor
VHQDEDPDTRTRLLQAALLLFRQRGYHGVGIRDILDAAHAPKGSLYHHFPGGKDQMAVEVLERVASRIVAMIEREPAATTAAAMHGVGLRLRKWMLETSASTSRSASRSVDKPADGDEGRGNACALIASFAAEGDTAAAVAAAARQAYERIAAVIAGRLEAEGAPPRQARDTAFLVIAMLEGGGLVSQTLGEPRLFTAAIERAAALCLLPAPAHSSPAVRKVPS